MSRLTPTLLAVLVMMLDRTLWCVQAQSEYESFYTREDTVTVCNINLRKQLGCTTEIAKVRGKLECIARCERDDFCVSVSMEATGKCFHHEACSSPIACIEGGERHPEIWSSYCVQGRWDKTTQTCVCRTGSYGPRCNKYPKDCGRLLNAGYSKGTYLTLVDPDRDGKFPLKVPCRIEPWNDHHRILILMNTGGTSFNRTWNDYVNGFYHDENNLWIGLRNLNLLTLTSASVCSDVFVLFFYVIDGLFSAVCQEYNGFEIQDKSSKYSLFFFRARSLTIGTHPAGDYADDCLLETVSKPFSTWDQNNDVSGGQNCAATKGWGWWHSGCDSSCNILGWGLDDWEGTPVHQRLSMMGVDMERARTMDVGTEIYCGYT